MDRKKHYLVYKTTCLLNGKIYIGQHQTYDPYDNYLGSGRELKKDIQELGEENFKREILFDFDTFDEMNDKEKELVTEEFVAREDTYNVRLGGQNNDDWYQYINEHHLANITQAAHLGGIATSKLMKDDKLFRQEVCSRISEGLKRRWKEHRETFIRPAPWLRGKLWIYNESLQENKFVTKDEFQKLSNEGWQIGRKMKFYK